MLRAYDPAFAYEMAVIIQDGLGKNVYRPRPVNDLHHAL